MKYIKLNLTTRSGFSNLLTADQIWGQMVWAISDLKSPDDASQFVREFINNPPFLISSMLPQNYLPKIILPPIKRDETNISEDEEVENRRIAKSNKKKSWIPIDVFSKYQKNISKIKLATFTAQPVIKSVNEIRTSIDRETWVANKGGLFNQNYLYSEEVFVIYLKILNEDEKWIKTIKDIVNYFNVFGLGGDKNVGKGNFNILINDLSKVELQIFNYSNGDFYTTLSKCSGKDLVPLYYQLDYYFGITGRSMDNNKSFNKFPALYYNLGSIFSKGSGQILENVHANSKVCSYGYSFPIYLNL